MCGYPAAALRSVIHTLATVMAALAVSEKAALRPAGFSGNVACQAHHQHGIGGNFRRPLAKLEQHHHQQNAAQEYQQHAGKQSQQKLQHVTSKLAQDRLAPLARPRKGRALPGLAPAFLQTSGQIPESNQLHSQPLPLISAFS